MVDFTIFDSILDCAFVVDSEGKIAYCNDAAATFCQSSVRRMVGKAKISDLVQLEEPKMLPFTESSPGRTEPTPFLETVFKVPKADRSGRVQVAVRPIDGTHWLFYLRDVSLEEALHTKYRSELAQKEEYARNLEKLVEARTAELRAVNLTLNAILNSLGQGFFTFNSQGDCGQVYTRACEQILEGIPVQKKAWDVLRVPQSEHDQFCKWTDSMFQEVLPFDDLRTLGPSLFAHSAERYVALEYYPIRNEKTAITDVVVVATDKTAERQAQLALEHERQYASMIVKFTKNRDQFLQFLATIRPTLRSLTEMAQTTMRQAQIAEAFRVLHTLEGESGTFSIGILRSLSRVSQQVIEPYKGQASLPEEAKSPYLESLAKIGAGFEEFLREHQDLFEVPDGEVERLVEVPFSNIHRFLDYLKSRPGSESLVESYQNMFMRVPIETRLKYFDGLIQSVAEKLGKRVKPLAIDGDSVTIFPDPYQKFFSSLVHAFRNAVDHGLEMPEDREWGGKPTEGTIRVQVKKSPSGEILMWISDDGKGIDPAVIRKKLAEKFPDRDFSKQSDDEIVQNVCMPGFSSREEIGEFSGRGVGLDALREEVLRLGGRIHIKSEVGVGTTIELSVPDLQLEPALLRSA